MGGKISKFLWKILIKLCEFFLFIYTQFKMGFVRDPSKILIDYYTDAQKKMQSELDLINFASNNAKGELLVFIPFKDGWPLTEDCLNSLILQKIPEHVSIRTILINNNSSKQETFENLKNVKNKFESLNIEILEANYNFNYSKLNNDAYKKFKISASQWVMFLNNDVQFKSSEMISQFLACLEQNSQVGIVGCTLLYPNQSIQHLFAAPGAKIVATHPLKGNSYALDFAWFKKPARPVPAVTGAVMVIRAIDFENINMFDESLPTFGQDIILCLKCYHILGKSTVTITNGGTIHHESITKPKNLPMTEVLIINDKYGYYFEGVPMYNAVFSKWSERPLLTLGEGIYPIFKVL